MFNKDAFEKASIKAITASFRQIRPFLLDQKDLGAIQTKPDQTLLTIADKRSEGVGFAVLRAAFPEVAIIREESGLSAGSADWEIWYDPIDGTAPFTIGAPTSTVICAAYDAVNKTLLSVAIGEPAYRRIWMASKGDGCKLVILNNEYEVEQSNYKKVWDGKLNHSTAVFLDITTGFLRTIGKRPITDDTVVYEGGLRAVLQDRVTKKIVKQLASNTRLQLYGSNGMHHALVANGNDKVVGGFTLAMGGQWDAAGALLITEAGGVCLAIAIEWIDIVHEIFNVRTEKKDPLNPADYDILIYANNQDNLNRLEKMFDKALNGNTGLYTRVKR